MTWADPFQSAAQHRYGSLYCKGGPLDGQKRAAHGWRLIAPGWPGHYQIQTEAVAGGPCWRWIPKEPAL